jgi:hypothetical protein
MAERRRAVVVDKLEKLPREKIEAELTELGVSQEAMDGLLTSLSLTCVPLTVDSLTLSHLAYSASPSRTALSPCGAEVQTICV